MYSIRKTNSKNKLSNLVNGVSQENFIFLVSFLFIGVSVFLITPFLINNHKRAVARNEWTKTQKSIPLSFTSGEPINTRRISLDNNEYYKT
jgi:hypothetical protein